MVKDLRIARRREVLAAAMRGAGVAGSLSVMLRYDAATPLVETQAQASMLSCVIAAMCSHHAQPLDCPAMRLLVTSSDRQSLSC